MTSLVGERAGTAARKKAEISAQLRQQAEEVISAHHCHDLAPCPHCGCTEPVLDVFGYSLGDAHFPETFLAASCPQCRFEGPGNIDRELAIEGWNLLSGVRGGGPTSAGDDRLTARALACHLGSQLSEACDQPSLFDQRGADLLSVLRLYFAAGEVSGQQSAVSDQRED